MDFKSLINSDIDVFLNLSEFGEVHILDGAQIIGIVSSNENTEKSSRKQNEQFYGISQSEVMLTTRVEFINVYKENDVVILDNLRYAVTKISTNDGVGELTLVRNE